MFGGKTLKFDLRLHICYIQRNLEGYGCKFATETGFQVASVLQDSTFAAPSVVLLGLGGPASPGPCRGRCGCGVVPDLCRRAGHTSPLDSGRRVRYARGMQEGIKRKLPYFDAVGQQMPLIPVGVGEFAEIDEYVSNIRELIASMINEVNFVLVSEHLDGSYFFEKIAIGDEFLTRHGITKPILSGTISVVPIKVSENSWSLSWEYDKDNRVRYNFCYHLGVIHDLKRDNLEEWKELGDFIEANNLFPVMVGCVFHCRLPLDQVRNVRP